MKNEPSRPHRSPRPGRLVRVASWALAAPLLLAVEVEAQSGPLEPHHVAALRNVVSTHPSPDGAAIAYVLNVQRTPLEDDSGSAWRELHVATDADDIRPFVTGEVRVSGIQWLDATTITFLDKRKGDDHRSLYSISTRGGEARKIVEHDADIRAYSLSPDGNTVVFLARDEVGEGLEKVRKKGFNQVIYEEDRPFTGLWRSALGDDGGEEAKPEELPVDGTVLSAEWSPNGEELIVVTAPTAQVDDTYMAKTVRLLDADTGEENDAMQAPGKLGAVHASPDGTTIAMISAADRNDPQQGRLLITTDLGGATTDLLPELEGHVQGIAWIDNEHLLYSAHIGVWSTVGKVSVRGEQTTLIEPGGPVLGGLALSRNGKLATFTGQTPEHPPELYGFELESGAVEAERLTESNPWLGDIQLGRQEIVEFEASDGLDLEGLLIYPTDYTEGERYPLILTVHGGPESHHSNAWLTSYSNLGQIAAGRGFAVFYTNYRGSTGRGVEFSKLGHADAAGKEFSDLIDAVDHLIDKGLVDKDRVGITGGSYGGYASAWATTYYSDRFAAAIPFVGISNNISKVGTTDIPVEMFEVHHRKWLWDDWNYFAERSPIYYVKRNRTPTLILHGEDDPRVHPSQSLELYRHLKVLDQAPVRLVFYPGEGHGNAKSAARFDYTLRTLRWFEHYLQGEGGEAPPWEIHYESFLPGAEEEAGEADPVEETSAG